MKSPHTPEAATLLFDLAGFYCDACDEGNEFAAAQAAKAMLEALRCSHVHRVLDLPLLDVKAIRSPQNGSEMVLVGMSRAVYLATIRPLLDWIESRDEPPEVTLPSATKRWPRATVN